MIDLQLAMELKAAGLVWHPEPGDRFAVPQPELLGQVFTLSDMTIEVHQRSSGPVLGFNGTTEWALDSVQAADAVWLPAEHQLRELLGPAFRGLRTVPGRISGDEHLGDATMGAGDSGAGAVVDGIPHDTNTGVLFEAVAEIPDAGERSFRAPVAEDAYASALLALVRRATGRDDVGESFDTG
jgi:hypothetical protein